MPYDDEYFDRLEARAERIRDYTPEADHTPQGATAIARRQLARQGDSANVVAPTPTLPVSRRD